MKLTRRFACLLVFGMFVTLPPELTFTSGQTSPQVFYGSRITISVRASKHFISGAQVTISRIISINPLNMKTISGKTNRYGEYSVSGLNLGTYSIHVEVNGYSPQVTEVLVGPGLFSHVYTYEM